jgi:hypothetical protein
MLDQRIGHGVVAAVETGDAGLRQRFQRDAVEGVGGEQLGEGRPSASVAVDDDERRALRRGCGAAVEPGGRDDQELDHVLVLRCHRAEGGDDERDTHRTSQYARV